MDKAILRPRILELRNGLSHEDVYTGSIAVQERIITNDVFHNAGRVCSYIAVGNEVDTRQIIDNAMTSGKEVTVPLLSPEGKTVVCMLKDVLFIYDTDFHVKMDIYNEPRLEVVGPGGSDLLIVPGVVFDIRGYRIGMGDGCYDRDILPREKKKGALFAGLAFEEQIVTEIDHEPHDIPMHMIVTPSRVIDLRPRNKKS